VGSECDIPGASIVTRSRSCNTSSSTSASVAGLRSLHLARDDQDRVDATRGLNASVRVMTVGEMESALSEVISDCGRPDRWPSRPTRAVTSPGPPLSSALGRRPPDQRSHACAECADRRCRRLLSPRRSWLRGAIPMDGLRQPRGTLALIDSWSVRRRGRARHVLHSGVGGRPPSRCGRRIRDGTRAGLARLCARAGVPPPPEGFTSTCAAPGAIQRASGVSVVGHQRAGFLDHQALAVGPGRAREEGLHPTPASAPSGTIATACLRPTPHASGQRPRGG
jgi:hypothetical protein